MKTQDWTWTKEGDVAVLRAHSRREPVKYNEASVREAFNNVIARRHEYATTEAWGKMLVMFGEGVALFEKQ